MVRITKVYTRTGDDGKTTLLGTRMPKNSVKVNALGSLDELNSVLGWTVLAIQDEQLDRLRGRLLSIQNALFDLGAFLSGRKETPFTDMIPRFETEIDNMNTKLEPLSSFILPGGTELSARLHIARTVCRRVERMLSALPDEEKTQVIPFINRLSDWLFVAARYSLKQQGTEESYWDRA